MLKTDFFIENLDVIYLFYGLVFIFIGVIIFLQLRITEKSEFRLLKILWFLALFGFSHGIHELIEMLIGFRGEQFYLRVLEGEFLFVSFLFLFLFGYKLINISCRNKLCIWFPPFILILFISINAYLFLNNLLDHDLWEISNRYFLGFPGAILSAIGFFLYYRSESKKLNEINVKKYFIIMSLILMSYGIFGGLIVPGGSFFPPSLINNTSFIDFFGFPVQFLRALTGIGISWSLWNIMKIFNIEEVRWRKHAETKLKDQAALLDKARDAIIVRNLEHIIIYWNKSASRLYGYKEEEVLGKNVDAILYKEELPVLIEARKRVIEEGEWVGELGQVSKEGEEIIVESHWTLVCDNEGRPKSILVINTDITEKKKLLSDIAEAKSMEESLRMFMTVLEEAPDGVRILDMNGYILYSNKAIEKIFGFSPEELKGRHISELHPVPEFFNSVLSPVIKENGRWNGELKLKSKDGKEIPVWLNTSVVKNSKDEPICMVGIIRDISYLKEKEYLEKQLMQADKLATIGQLASGVAHEINNPLGNISLYAQMLLKKTEDEVIRKKLNIINDEANRASHIVKGLLDFARQSELKLAPININKEIDKVLDIIKPQLWKIKVDTEFQPLPIIQGDPNQIDQVIMNMLTNSIQAMKGDGEILITTLSKKDNIEISILDNGCGIPKEKLPKIFDPFFTTKETGEGTGLGLAISYGIIERHHGSIEVKSEVGKGTTFTIKLPI